MRRIRSNIVALFGALVATPGAAVLADGEIVVAAQEAVAAVAPRAAHLKLVNLPPLEFALRAAIQCKGEPVSVTLSVADTFVTIGADALAGARSAEEILEVPATQLALAASSRFCLVDDPESADELLVPGFATAHASLRCARDDASSAHFASAPLQLRLSCARPVAETQVPLEADESR